MKSECFACASDKLGDLRPLPPRRGKPVLSPSITLRINSVEVIEMGVLIVAKR